MRFCQDCKLADGHHSNCPSNDDIGEDEEDMDSIDYDRADWSTQVSRHLMLAGATQAEDSELEAYWTAGLDPLQAAARLVADRDNKEKA